MRWCSHWLAYRPIAQWCHNSYTSIQRQPCWGAEMYCSDWEKGTNRIALRELQQDLRIQVYMYMYTWVSLYLTNICKSCWSSQLRLQRAIQLVPISQSLQYISALQHGGHCMEVYKHDVTVQWVYCVACMIGGASKYSKLHALWWLSVSTLTITLRSMRIRAWQNDFAVLSRATSCRKINE